MITIKSATGNQPTETLNKGKKVINKKVLLILLGVIAVGGVAYLILKNRKSGGEGSIEEPIDLGEAIPAGE